MEASEVASALGVPGRLGARVLFLPRYLLEGVPAVRSWTRNDYACARFGKSYRWRFWLMFDIRHLEAMEKLINHGSDEDLMLMRESQLESFRLIALVGALLAAVALQALSLPSLAETHFTARAQFIIAVSLSVLATFFTCIQQREFSTARNPSALRAWLSNGVRYENCHGEYVFQSSMAVRHLLDCPYEFLAISVANFMGGMASYLGSAWVKNIALGNNETNGRRLEDLAVIVYFGIGTIFAGSVFNLLLASKNKESSRTGDVLEEFAPRRRKENEAHRGIGAVDREINCATDMVNRNEN